jgi:hypothetical protein
LTVLIVGSYAASRSEDSAVPLSEGFGFDWLQPETARCARITPVEIKTFTRCEFHTSGAFGLPLSYHACATPRGGEFLVFISAAVCQEVLETMQANAP